MLCEGVAFSFRISTHLFELCASSAAVAGPVAVTTMHLAANMQADWPYQPTSRTCMLCPPG